METSSNPHAKKTVEKIRSDGPPAVETEATAKERDERVLKTEAAKERLLFKQQANSILSINILTELQAENKSLKASLSDARKEIAKLKGSSLPQR
ncbi:hypothetical protein V6N11_055468 [Hibiscus sabdariffa]|uniref:Uncharacterized protein n=1 Tax=Hibiscus sabdariffa TaxID=183260 RepID=A0ABR2PFC7_9ROSI